MKNKEWFFRARRTFLQGAIGYLAGALPVLFSDCSITKVAIAGALASAIMTGLAAVMNMTPKSAGADAEKETESSETLNAIVDVILTPETSDTASDEEDIVEESEGEG